MHAVNRQVTAVETSLKLTELQERRAVKVPRLTPQPVKIKMHSKVKQLTLKPGASIHKRNDSRRQLIPVAHMQGQGPIQRPVARTSS